MPTRLGPPPLPAQAGAAIRLRGLAAGRNGRRGRWRGRAGAVPALRLPPVPGGRSGLRRLARAAQTRRGPGRRRALRGAGPGGSCRGGAVRGCPDVLPGRPASGGRTAGAGPPAGTDGPGQPDRGLALAGVHRGADAARARRRRRRRRPVTGPVAVLKGRVWGRGLTRAEIPHVHCHLIYILILVYLHTAVVDA